MKITALSVILLVGSVSSVSAAPVDKETTERVSYTDKGRARAPALDDTWVELASPTPASHAREFIQIDPAHGPFVRLRLDAAAGRPIVRTVRIEYSDGTFRLVRIDKVLDKKRPAYVDLRGPKRIERVVVVSEGSKRMTYSVLGEPVRNSVATR